MGLAAAAPGQEGALPGPRCARAGGQGCEGGTGTCGSCQRPTDRAAPLLSGAGRLSGWAAQYLRPPDTQPRTANNRSHQAPPWFTSLESANPLYSPNKRLFQRKTQTAPAQRAWKRKQAEGRLRGACQPHAHCPTSRSLAFRKSLALITDAPRSQASPPSQLLQACPSGTEAEATSFSSAGHIRPSLQTGLPARRPTPRPTRPAQPACAPGCQARRAPAASTQPGLPQRWPGLCPLS